MFQRRTTRGEQRGPNALDADTLLLAIDTIAGLLRTLAINALPTAAYPLDDFQQQCEALCLEALTRKPPPDATEPRPLGQVFGEAHAVVREQRQAEAAEYRTHRESAAILVANLVGRLRQTLVQRDSHDTEIVSLLAQMEDVVALGDLESIRQVSSEAASRIRDVLAERRASDQGELEKLSEQLATMRQELAAARTQAKRDALTELINRGGFDDGAGEVIEICRLSGTPVTLFMLDIDHFKAVNDTHGHPVGDLVIQAVARQLSRAFPRQDDMVARYGGEEFVVLCQNVGAEHAPMLGERVRRAVSELEVAAPAGLVRPTVSVGYAVYRRNEAVEVLIQRADQALYAAKQNGRNRVEAAGS